MLESSPACPRPNYSHIVHSPKDISPIAPQLNYITDIVLELKAELAEIKTEIKELKKQLSVIHLSLVNKVKHSGKSTSSISTPFHHKYPLQNPKNKNPLCLHDIKIWKEVGEKSCEKSAKKAEKEEDAGVQAIYSWGATKYVWKRTKFGRIKQSCGHN